MVVAVFLVFRARQMQGALTLSSSLQVISIGSVEHAKVLKCNCQMWCDVCRNFSFRGVVEWQVWSITMHTAHIMVATYWQSLVRSKAHRAASSNVFVNDLSFLAGF